MPILDHEFVPGNIVGSPEIRGVQMELVCEEQGMLFHADQRYGQGVHRHIIIGSFVGSLCREGS